MYRELRWHADAVQPLTGNEISGRASHHSQAPGVLLVVPILSRLLVEACMELLAKSAGLDRRDPKTASAAAAAPRGNPLSPQWSGCLRR